MTITLITNHPPTDVGLDNASVVENQPVGTTIGTFSTTDSDAGDTFTYTFVDGEGSTDNALFDISGNTLKTTTSFDYEEKDSYSVRICSTDQGGLSTEKAFTINIINVNEQPTDIFLSKADVAENQPVGTVVGVASGTDPDASQSATLTFSLVSGYGDNSLFTIDPATKQLKTAAVFDYEAKSSYSIEIRATDTGTPALIYDKAFTVSITDVNESPIVATAASATPSLVTGMMTNLSVLGTDDGGEANLTYTWLATALPSGATAPTFSINATNAAKNTTATFSKAGSYTFQVTIADADGLPTTSNVSVTVNQTLTTVTVSPASVTLNENQTQQFTATGKDQFGVVLSSQPGFTWAKASGVGSISAGGLYTAPAAIGSASITATSGSVVGSAAVTINNTVPTVATAATAAPSPVTGSSTVLSVLGADDGGESNLTYTWATTGTPPAVVTFIANGTNAAKNTTATFSKAGSYAFQVTITDAGGLSTTSNVSVTVNQTLTTITVSPATASLSAGGTQQFTATGKDQFGVALATQPTFTWATTAGLISAGGLLTAPSTSVNNGTVTASTGTVSSIAAITVANQAPTVEMAASAMPSPVTGTTTDLSVLGADDAGEGNLSYIWVVTTLPSEATAPSFSVNSTNAAKNTTATFSKAGSYTFTVTVTDAGGLTVTSSVDVTVNQPACPSTM